MKYYAEVTVKVLMDVPFTEEEILSKFHHQNVIQANLELVLPDGSVHKGEGDIEKGAKWELIDEE
jgi:hypothetical protein